MIGVTLNNYPRTRPRHQGAAFCVAAVLAWFALSFPACAASPAHAGFKSPEQAVAALILAARSNSTADLLQVLGPASKRLVSSGDAVADDRARASFVAEFDEANKIIKQGDDRAVLVIGKDEWAFPIPAVKHASTWRFDTKAGEQEIINRRIGANELSTIEVCRAYVDAQRDYATTDRNHDGYVEYAQKFVSSPGKRDGLYWPAQAGEDESPIGPLMARARAEGYGAAKIKPASYHGYYYRILKAQGPHAPGGAVSYVARGHMIGGFALVAFPAQYGESGIKTFIVNHDGIVYEKDLGPDTAKIASGMTRYDPDGSWKTP